jgi:radical SAM superfamily enzyme YgiQ (UPF0313 family)
MLGALYVASAVRRSGVRVQICDLAGMPEEYWHIPVGDVYGLTGVTPQFPYMKKIIDKLKAREPHKRVIVGGVHASVLPEHILENTQADVCVVGEGEEIAPAVVRGSMRGIVGANRIEDLDDLHFPDRASIDYYDYLVPQTYKYLAGGENIKEASIITSRGCPYSCNFCASENLWGRKVRYRTARSVFSELAWLKRDYDIKLCNFVDDTFILNEKRIREICRLLLTCPLDIDWFCLTRVDCVDPYLFDMMRDAGCLSVTFGFESGSNRVLEVIGKNTTVEQADKAIDVVKAAGMKIRGQLMVGLPTETEEDIELTAEFIKKSEKVDTFGLHVFQPFPGCEFWENPEDYGLEIDKDTDFDGYHTIGKPGERLTDNDEIWERYLYLKSVISDRSIEVQ